MLALVQTHHSPLNAFTPSRRGEEGASWPLYKFLAIPLQPTAEPFTDNVLAIAYRSLYFSILYSHSPALAVLNHKKR